MFGGIVVDMIVTNLHKTNEHVSVTVTTQNPHKMLVILAAGNYLLDNGSLQVPGGSLEEKAK